MQFKYKLTTETQRGYKEKEFGRTIVSGGANFKPSSPNPFSLMAKGSKTNFEGSDLLHFSKNMISTV